MRWSLIDKRWKLKFIHSGEMNKVLNCEWERKRENYSNCHTNMAINASKDDAYSQSQASNEKAKRLKSWAVSTEQEKKREAREKS